MSILSLLPFSIRDANMGEVLQIELPPRLFFDVILIADLHGCIGTTKGA